MSKRGNQTWSKHNLNSATVGEYMYVEMAHYTDDDTIVLICVTNSNDFKVHEYKLEKLKDKNWSFLVQRFCSGNSSDQILNNVETLFASLEFQVLVKSIYKLILQSDSRLEAGDRPRESQEGPYEMATIKEMEGRPSEGSPQSSLD
mmetsp:Transcript_21714/g.33454  ORF Transcript_21714/g.33454 Transcript_21714/m.33454 type:complete len:146 (-) Transcript_21714:45-482(-)